MKELRSSKKNEDRRHGRLMKNARKLDARDQMEMAALKQLSEAQMLSFADEMGVQRSSLGQRNVAAERPEEPSATSGQVVVALEDREPDQEEAAVLAAQAEQAEDLEALS